MTVSRTSIWHDDRLEPKLRELWALGHTTIHIAAELSKIAGVRITKNSVISKRSRLGVPQERPSHPDRPTALRGHARNVVRKPVAPKVRPDPYAGQGVPKRLRAKVLPAVHERPLTTGKKTLIELLKDECRYPTSDGLFCSDPVLDGKSYCPGHHKICTWQPDRRVMSGTDLARSLRRFYT